MSVGRGGLASSGAAEQQHTGARLAQIAADRLRPNAGSGVRYLLAIAQSRQMLHLYLNDGGSRLPGQNNDRLMRGRI